ncbi:MAG: hypothetical protein IJU41_06320 [Clostridia bacterium]|nr:hypothetical protein [Clostridia bacterium]
MYKFDPLTDYLEKRGTDTVTLSFSDIERIISVKLCPSARKYQQYWQLCKTHRLPLAVDCAGYTIDSVSLTEEKVVIKKK